jgi:hypothetical protein
MLVFFGDWWSSKALRRVSLVSSIIRQEETQAMNEIEVRSRFDGTWVRGFEVAEQTAGADRKPAVRLRRRSDGTVLPTLFSLDEVRDIPGGTLNAEARRDLRL